MNPDLIKLILRYGIVTAYQLWEISRKDEITDEDWSYLLTRAAMTKEEGVAEAKARLKARGIKVE